ncbi:hypothetical protein PG991_012561 [Apiospora marii]|uniref:Uncharacterized protein n=1 Tax=Apiospora marii TaxID=335849 RepID=A0ABR1RB43_9PEZI
MAHLMDPDEWDEDTAAMAEAMGFASFGGQSHGSKRRKYNARADDAFVAGGDESTLPFHDAGSGSNNTPLGERRPQQQPAAKKQKTNMNEIDLDDDDDDEDQYGGNDDGNTGTAAAVASKEAHDAAQDPEPQYIDTSQPRNQAQPGLPAKPTWGPYAGSGEGHTQPGRPDRPRHGGRGGRNSQEPWWTDYYDPAFNTNPWEQIEKAQGMEPRGTWLSYDESKAKWAAIRSQAVAAASSSASAPATVEAVAQAA